MRVLILAAGQGKRMSPLTDIVPKPLLSFGKDSIIVRIISQIIDRFSGDISVVVGHEGARVSNEVKNAFGERVSIVNNYDYRNDVNILSLSLGLDLDKEVESFIVFESDCIFDDSAMDRIFDEKIKLSSAWFTIGSFLSSQVGGIVKTDNRGFVEDLLVVKKYKPKYNDYNKLIGVLKVGPSEVKKYVKCLKEEVKVDTNQYYLSPWIKNLSSLPCKAVSLEGCCTGAFNTPEEYYSVLNNFEKNIHV